MRQRLDHGDVARAAALVDDEVEHDHALDARRERFVESPRGSGIFVTSAAATGPASGLAAGSGAVGAVRVVLPTGTAGALAACDVDSIVTPNTGVVVVGAALGGASAGGG